MSRFDWPGLLRAGVLGLGMRPADVWALTPAELKLLLGEREAPLDRARLDALMGAFPDGEG